MPDFRLHLGDCLQVMPTMEENSFHSIVSDPPYGLSFMGKNWDHGLPGVPFWEQALRVAKPGAFLLAFGGTRTYHRLTCAIEDAGWEIRDCLMWLYGQGFPKSDNSLKPAWEPIVLAMKPTDGTFANNALAHGVAGLNVDACRIEGNAYNNGEQYPEAMEKFDASPQGRWPANLLLDEEAAAMLDEMSGELSTCGGPKKTTHNTGMFGIGTPGAIYKDRGGASRFFLRVAPADDPYEGRQPLRMYYCGKASKRDRNEGLEGLEKRLASEAGGRRNVPAGTQGGYGGPRENFHPTVKPTALMRWLVRLVTPPGGTVLDPFLGSGSTGKAAMLEGFHFAGIDTEAEYLEIARRRIKFAQDQVRMPLWEE